MRKCLNEAKGKKKSIVASIFNLELPFHIRSINYLSFHGSMIYTNPTKTVFFGKLTTVGLEQTQSGSHVYSCSVA